MLGVDAGGTFTDIVSVKDVSAPSKTDTPATPSAPIKPISNGWPSDSTVSAEMNPLSTK